MSERRRRDDGRVTVVRILFRARGFSPALEPAMVGCLRAMSLLVLQVNFAAETRIAAGHPQLPLSDSLPDQGIEPGRPVRLVSTLGAALGVGVCDPENELIRVWEETSAAAADEPPWRELGAAFFKARVRRALALRRTLGLADGVSCYRLLNAEGDGLSGLTIDIYGGFGVVTALSRGLMGHARLLAEAALAELPGVGVSLRGIVIKARPKNSDAGAAEAVTPSARAKDVVIGDEPPAKLIAHERGIPYEVHLRGGFNVGLFTDMREHRAGLLRFVAGARVLNTFAYTGSLSLAAARGGARTVTSVDLAAGPLAWARENFRLSGLDPETDNFRWEACDVFRFIEAERARQAEYDVVILDPPTVSGARATSWAQKRDYPELIAAATRLMPGGGHLWISSNTHRGPGLMRHVEAGLTLARRRAVVLEIGGLPPDYPTPAAWPAARYLEVCQLRVI
jgi:23S rRNA (cytosine1962-C5)-methyltransferase